jgi:uncharacterized membrane protein YoaK (UPF0700 family)
MPIAYVRRLTAGDRTPSANLHLGVALAFVAGAVNAGGFLAVHQYTSHMTGIVSSIADQLVLGAFDVVAVGCATLLAFLLGAISSTLLVNLARSRRLHIEYAGPLLLEALLLLAFGVLGARLADLHAGLLPATVALLGYIMGLQNAVISKISRAEIRTTHVTGILTDLGVELGRWLHGSLVRWPDDRPLAPFDAARLRTLGALFAAFFVGGLVGALGFSRAGYASTVPLALLLIALAWVPASDDLRAAWRRWRG